MPSEVEYKEQRYEQHSDGASREGYHEHHCSKSRFPVGRQKLIDRDIDIHEWVVMNNIFTDTSEEPTPRHNEYQSNGETQSKIAFWREPRLKKGKLWCKAAA